MEDSKFQSRLPLLPRLRAMTILEVMVVLVIIGILASMLVPLYSRMTTRADEIHCVSNLKALHVAASGYLQAVGAWPQIPPKLIIEDPVQYAHSWVDALKPYGVTHKVWICPAMQRSLGVSMEAIDKPDAKPEDYRVDFVAAPFDDNPASPLMNPTYPWFMERAGLHPRGNLVILTDGSTTSLFDLTGKTPDN
jgi:prepilin-type N-terminal cleavage/methylation domain-containing protein